MSGSVIFAMLHKQRTVFDVSNTSVDGLESHSGHGLVHLPLFVLSCRDGSRCIWPIVLPRSRAILYKICISEFNSEVNQASGFIRYTLKTKKTEKEKERRSAKSLCHLWHMADSCALKAQ